ncbi:hypothetical protein DDJ48_21900 [Mycobacteroides abscessus]|nr:hypothetical protein B9M85_01490 [Mycobacteroides abscessus]RTZ41425.1 hypothetical protein CJN95_025980 [Mycobacteroides abscessus subsp. abscessus]OTR25539.1 hypothetical protein B9M79_20770 [Mycobacteroides abscessus]PVA24695.1 hypothetical protein DDJ36_26405 [Mycobacteroides abscessus]PVA42847.1 hypothetical protein DDJ48_21900 [Mycobacteroides abscessus]
MSISAITPCCTSPITGARGALCSPPAFAGIDRTDANLRPDCSAPFFRCRSSLRYSELASLHWSQRQPARYRVRLCTSGMGHASCTAVAGYVQVQRRLRKGSLTAESPASSFAENRTPLPTRGFASGS